MKRIFISYSRNKNDNKWKDRLAKHLKVFTEDLDVWDDQRISAGDDWLPEIQQAINQSSAAILLVSVDFLTSKFIREKEIPLLLQRKGSEGTRIIPLIVSACAWKSVKWLNTIQARPRDLTPLSGLRGTSEHPTCSQARMGYVPWFSKPCRPSA